MNAVLYITTDLPFHSKGEETQDDAADREVHISATNEEIATQEAHDKPEVKREETEVRLGKCIASVLDAVIVKFEVLPTSLRFLSGLR